MGHGRDFYLDLDMKILFEKYSVASDFDNQVQLAD